MLQKDLALRITADIKFTIHYNYIHQRNKNKTDPLIQWNVKFLPSFGENLALELQSNWGILQYLSKFTSLRFFQ